VVPATVVETGPCIVVQKKVATTDGYNALQVGFGSKKNQRVNKATQGHMAKAGKGAFEVLREFRLEDVGPYEIGQEIKAGDLFKVGDRIDVSGTSKGHGFSGVIKRWSFGGFPGSHGTHEYFRHGGSIGNRSYPGRVRKGKKMAGHWGNEIVSTQNLEVVEIRAEENLLLVRGAVPGAKRGIVILRPAVKR
jgi:large subunit ribosomal protein L3